MDDLDAYAAPKADLAGTPHEATPVYPGCCLIPCGCSLLGLILGGVYGLIDFRAAVAREVEQSGFADFLPVGVLFLAIVGAVLGAMSGASLVAVWLLVTGSQAPDHRDG